MEQLNQPCGQTSISSDGPPENHRTVSHAPGFYPNGQLQKFPESTFSFAQMGSGGQVSILEKLFL
jgi:hypothetical protein